MHMPRHAGCSALSNCSLTDSWLLVQEPARFWRSPSVKHHWLHWLRRACALVC